MSKIIFFLVFAGTYVQAQNIEDKLAFKKCHKEFSKKICLSDEDNDSLLFYLDKCPNEIGPVENHGCPWPDTDKDGTLDKDDACPTIFGVPENNGCPPSTKQDDCEKFYKQQQIKYEQFQTEHQDIGKIYSLLNKRILKDALNLRKKDMLNNNFGISFGYIQFSLAPDGGCDDPNPTKIKNYLISKFWNKDIFEYASKKYNKEILIRRMYFDKYFNPELEKLMGKDTFQYLLQYSNKNNNSIIIPSKTSQKPENYIPIYIQFITPYKIEIVNSASPKIYEYKNGQWESNKK
ncbi:hypothetical protein [Chryseobacterium jejuense]|uniref:Alpha-agarase n=1 Tax=Chryseobacterium jejuense TaxID=445960 RepID=A0A2X2Z3Y6_CHRJE|nr:hypothetical protein SAMN05421542_0656 [Chryseobacterium jejuense]SQB44509.1 Uncharacterised protein [Chryseobacterium jejuense]